MSSTPGVTGHESNLIRAYQDAANQQRLANRIATIAIIATVLLFIYLIWSQFSRFVNEDLTEFSASLGVEATEFMPTVVKGLDEMTGRLVPVYIDSFTTVLERDESKYLEVVQREFQALDAYAVNEAWPKMQEALAQLVVDQETAFKESMQGLMTREQIADLSFAYRDAMEAYLGNTFEAGFTEQTATGEMIITKLEKLATTADEDMPTNSHYIIGMLLELLGLEIQEAAAIEPLPFNIL